MTVSAKKRIKKKCKRLSTQYKAQMKAAKKFASIYNKYHGKGERRKAKKYQNKEIRAHKKCSAIEKKISKLKAKLK